MYGRHPISLVEISSSPTVTTWTRSCHPCLGSLAVCQYLFGATCKSVLFIGIPLLPHSSFCFQNYILICQYLSSDSGDPWVSQKTKRHPFWVYQLCFLWSSDPTHHQLVNSWQLCSPLHLSPRYVTADPTVQIQSWSIFGQRCFKFQLHLWTILPRFLPVHHYHVSLLLTIWTWWLSLTWSGSFDYLTCTTFSSSRTQWHFHSPLKLPWVVAWKETSYFSISMVKGISNIDNGWKDVMLLKGQMNLQ